MGPGYGGEELRGGERNEAGWGGAEGVCGAERSGGRSTARSHPARATARRGGKRPLIHQNTHDAVSRVACAARSRRRRCPASTAESPHPSPPAPPSASPPPPSRRRRRRCPGHAARRACEGGGGQLPTHWGGPWPRCGGRPGGAYHLPTYPEPLHRTAGPPPTGPHHCQHRPLLPSRFGPHRVQGAGGGAAHGPFVFSPLSGPAALLLGCGVRRKATATKARASAGRWAGCASRRPPLLRLPRRLRRPRSTRGSELKIESILGGEGQSEGQRETRWGGRRSRRGADGGAQDGGESGLKGD
jgi:hypothetical protein